MKTLTICLIIVFISIFGLNATSGTSGEQTRNEQVIQIVKADKQFGFTTETNLVSNTSPFSEMNSLEEDKYIPSQFKFLKEEENDNLIYRVVFDIFLKK